MSDGIASSPRFDQRRGIAGLALTFLLAGCFWSGDPSDTSVAGGGEPAEVVQPPTSAGPADQIAWDVDPGPDLYRVDPSTGGAEEILSMAGELHEPEVSPDGSQVLYQGFAPNLTSQIFVLGRGARASSPTFLAERGSRHGPPTGNGSRSSHDTRETRRPPQTRTSS